MQRYSFKNCVLLVNGIPIEGFAEGDDVIVGKRLNDPFSHKMGADGKMTVAQSADKSGEIVIKLMQGSKGSSTLGLLFNLLEAGRIDAVAVMYVNTKSGESCTGVHGYIKRPADMSRGAGVNSEEWAIDVENYNAFFSELAPLGILASLPI